MSDHHIFDLSDRSSFEEYSLRMFHQQYQQVTVYRNFCDALNRNPENVSRIDLIPFLPIQFFKSHKVIRTGQNEQLVFRSSGTTGSPVSKHYVSDPALYENSFLNSFEMFFGSVSDLVILALLPSYLEREGSSLVYMVDRLIQLSGSPDSGFYLHNERELVSKLVELEAKGRNTLLIGVSFALLDLVEKQRFNLKHTTVMETGGMKGRRKEMIREELHEKLCEGFGVSKICSEYGMTELLSQAYSTGDGVFECPPWMRLITRNTEDPLGYVVGQTGGINVIDLANQNSCSFIATQDLGKIRPDGSFNILGRFDHSDIRGCNLMAL